MLSRAMVFALILGGWPAGDTRAEQAKPRGTTIDLGRQVSTEINTSPLGVAVKGWADLSGAWSKRTGRVAAVNVTADVTFIGEGGLLRQQLRSFDNLLITSSAGPGTGGDISVMVEDVDPCPKPVGLVHASSASFALALPMTVYVQGFGVTLTNGCTAAPGASPGGPAPADPATVTGRGP